MPKRPSIRLAVGLLAACGVTVGSLIATTASANAATYSCSGSGSSRHCYAYEDTGGPVFYPDGQLEGIVVTSTELEITCWYYGTSPGWSNDGYEDHIVWMSTVGAFTGHAPDYYVNFGGHDPNAPSIALPECG
ncbi:MAG TPA: hypothetical protein VMU95_32880 [Trebonia sp.]|nr:hypothetical protein [Trebonia sp.]